MDTNGAFPDYPFLDRMSITFVLIIVVMVIMSLMKKEEAHEVQVSKNMFRVTPGFAIYSIIILGILTALYTIFW